MGTVAVAAVFAAALPAAARGADRRVHFAFSGSVTLSWHGDPARGCAAAGLCDYTGSVTLGRPPDTDLTFSRGIVIGSSSSSESDAAIAVRVQRDQAGGAGGGCVDSLPGDLLGFTADRVGATRYALRIAGDASAGRCAGPLPDDLTAAIAAPTVDIGALGPQGSTVRWPAGALAAGPFSGQVTSTLTARVTRAPPPPRPPHGLIPSPRRIVRARRLWATVGGWTYTVHAITGSVGASLEGAGDCLLLDSCGVSGTVDYRLDATGGRLAIAAERLAATPPPRRRTGAVDRSALSIDGFGELSARAGTITASLARPGEPPCADTASASPPELSAGRERARLIIALGGPESGGDVLRTRCPGPSQADVFGGGSVVRASLPLAALGRRRLRVTLSRPGSFSGPGYAGARHGAIVLDLRLAGTHRLRTVTRRQP